MEISGLLLESKYPEYRLVVKGPMQKVWRDGFPVDEPKIMTLEFDRFICDVEQIAIEQEWTPGDIEAVENTLKRHLSDPTFRDVWIHEIPKPPKPWPNYDEMPEAQVAVVAQATEMIDAALAYETRGRKPRPKVVTALEKAQAETPAVTESDTADDLTAV